MVCKAVPIPYQVILEHFDRVAFKQKIEIAEAKRILRYIYRMPRDKIFSIFREMRDLGYVEVENTRTLILK